MGLNRLVKLGTFGGIFVAAERHIPVHEEVAYTFLNLPPNSSQLHRFCHIIVAVTRKRENKYANAWARSFKVDCLSSLQL
jgi:hypothetical protein